MSLYKKSLLSLFFLVRLTVLFGQSEQIKFENLSKDDGLLHNFVNAVFQDNEGYVWVGTFAGLSCTDGTTVRSYNRSNRKDMVSSTILSIHQTYQEDSIIWLGTNNGLIQYNKNSDRFTKVGELNFPITKIVSDEEGSIWLGSEKNGLWQLKPKSRSIQNTKLNGFFTDLHIRDIICKSGGQVWLATVSHGLIKYASKSGDYFQYQLPPLNGEPVSIYSIYDEGNSFLVGTWGKSLLRFELNALQFNSIKTDLPLYRIIKGIEKDYLGNIWVASYGGGAFRLKPTAGDQYSVDQFNSNLCAKQAISSDVLQGLYKDKTGNLWIPTSGAGIDKLDFLKHRFKHLLLRKKGQEEVRNNLLSCTIDSKQQVWLGTTDNGIFVENLEGSQHQILLNSKGKGHPANVVRCIYEDAEKIIWIGTDAGVYKSVNGQSPALFIPVENFPVNARKGGVRSFCRDKAGNLWMAIYDGGLFKVNATNLMSTRITATQIQSWNFEQKESGNLLTNEIWNIVEEQDGNLWLCTGKGLATINQESGNTEIILEDNIGVVFKPQHQNRLRWIGTFGRGLQLFNTNSGKRYSCNLNEKLNHGIIYGIQEDRNGKVWISTNNGILNFDPTLAYEEALKGQPSLSKLKAVRFFSKEDGLQSNEFGLNASGKLQDGRIVFGGKDGINIFDPSAIIENNVVFPVIITDVRFQNKSILLDSAYSGQRPPNLKELFVQPANNYLSIDFNQICHTSPQLVQFEYQLVGYDNTWVKTDYSRRTVTYTQLAPGEYEFKLVGYNASGVKGEEKSMTIHILPHWYQTTWFKILAVGILLLSIFYAYLQMKNYYKKVNTEKLEIQKKDFEQEKLQTDLDYKNRELTANAMYLINRNEKLIEIKTMIAEATMNLSAKDQQTFNKIVTGIDHLIEDKDNWEQFEKNFNRADNDFIRRLTESFPELSQNDIRICTYIRMNLSSKEIANLLNITPRSLETSRFRIRKKMGLDSGGYLSEFIMKF